MKEDFQAKRKVIRCEPERRQQLMQRAAQLRERLEAMGLDVGQSTTQIVPIVLGDNELAVATSARLRELGMFVPAIRPPAVPSRLARLRISLCSGHTEKQLDQLCDSLSILKHPG